MAVEVRNRESLMGEEIQLVKALHTSTKRDYLVRMNDDKIHCMLKAKEYEVDYWDGDRRYGYGGYRYMPGRWVSVAESLIVRYGLTEDSKILDVGCGKGFLLFEIQKLLPGIKIHGFDISKYGLKNIHPALKGNFFEHKAQDAYPYKDKEFDLVLSLGCLHNLKIFDIEKAIQEIERVGQRKYIMVEGYRSEAELFNLACWALTAESLLHKDEWLWLYDRFGYTGDFEFIYFE